MLASQWATWKEQMWASQWANEKEALLAMQWDWRRANYLLWFHAGSWLHGLRHPEHEW